MNEWNETAIEQAVDAIGHAKQVVVSGSGDSRIGAVMLHNNLSLQNKNTYHTMDQVEEQNLLVRLQEQDVFVGFTYTGRYRYMAQNFKTAKQMGATTIGIMGIPWSETEKYVDIPLYTSSGNKKYYFGSNNSAEDE